MCLLKLNQDFEEALKDAKLVKELDGSFPGIDGTIKELEKLHAERFEKMKDEMSNDVDVFITKFETFLNSSSPSQWRSTGSAFSGVLGLKTTIKNSKPLTLSDLEHKFVRDEVLTDEEKELYNKSKKFNL